MKDKIYDSPKDLITDLQKGRAKYQKKMKETNKENLSKAEAKLAKIKMLLDKLESDIQDIRNILTKTS